MLGRVGVARAVPWPSVPRHAEWRGVRSRPHSGGRTGGEGGIRTLDGLPHTAFPVRRPRPLGDLSAVRGRAESGVAERAGFEPAVLAHTAFRERHHQPLGHLSAGEDSKRRHLTEVVALRPHGGCYAAALTRVAERGSRRKERPNNALAGRPTAQRAAGDRRGSTAHPGRRSGRSSAARSCRMPDTIRRCPRRPVDWVARRTEPHAPSTGSGSA